MTGIPARAASTVFRGSTPADALATLPEADRGVASKRCSPRPSTDSSAATLTAAVRTVLSAAFFELFTHSVFFRGDHAIYLKFNFDQTSCKVRGEWVVLEKLVLS